MFNEKVEYTYGVYKNISRSEGNCLVRISRIAATFEPAPSAAKSMEFS
jgi:hypothetical protein